MSPPWNLSHTIGTRTNAHHASTSIKVTQTILELIFQTEQYGKVLGTVVKTNLALPRCRIRAPQAARKRAPPEAQRAGIASLRTLAMATATAWTSARLPFKQRAPTSTRKRAPSEAQRAGAVLQGLSTTAMVGVIALFKVQTKCALPPFKQRAPTPTRKCVLLAPARAGVASLRTLAMATATAWASHWHQRQHRRQRQH